MKTDAKTRNSIAKKPKTKPTRAPGRPTGTTKDDAKKGVIVVRCRLEDKGRYVRAARRQGQKLSEWVLDAAEEKLERQG